MYCSCGNKLMYDDGAYCCNCMDKAGRLVRLEKEGKLSELDSCKAERDAAIAAKKKAEAELAKPRCEHCGSTRILSVRCGCPDCGAPVCCQTCCHVNTVEMQRDAALASVKRLELEREEHHRLHSINLADLRAERDAALARAEKAEGERDELAQVLEHANVELAALVEDPSQAAGKASMWPLENAADCECIRSAFAAIRGVLKKQEVSE